MHFKVIIIIIYLEVSKDGSVYAKRINPGISEKLLKVIHSWRREGASDKDVIIRLR